MPQPRFEIAPAWAMKGAEPGYYARLVAASGEPLFHTQVYEDKPKAEVAVLDIIHAVQAVITHRDNGGEAFVERES